MKRAASSRLLAGVSLILSACADSGGGDAASIPTAGRVLHVEADNGVSLVGSQVSRWADQSGISNDGTPLSKPPVSGSSVLAGAAVLRFAGDAGPTVGAQGLTFGKELQTGAGSSSFVLLRVQDPGAPLNDIALSVPELRGLDSDEGTIGAYAYAADGKLTISYRARGNVLEASVSQLDKWVLLEAVQEGSGNVRLFVDGEVVAQGNLGAPATMSRTVALSGGLTSAETGVVLVYNRAVSDEERRAIEQHVQRKWNYR